MSYTIIHMSDVVDARKAGVKWKVRLEYIGPNPNNKNGWSEKFWEMYADGKGIVSINHGKIGSAGLKNPGQKDFMAASAVCTRKKAEGYKYVPQTSPAGAFLSSAPPSPRRSKSKRTNKPVPAQAAPTPPTPVAPEKVELPGIFGLIFKVILVDAGNTAEAWAVDANGNHLMKLSEEGVEELFLMSPWVKHNSEAA